MRISPRWGCGPVQLLASPPAVFAEYFGAASSLELLLAVVCVWLPHTHCLVLPHFVLHVFQKCSGCILLFCTHINVKPDSSSVWFEPPQRLVMMEFIISHGGVTSSATDFGSQVLAKLCGPSMASCRTEVPVCTMKGLVKNASETGECVVDQAYFVFACAFMCRFDAQ